MKLKFWPSTTVMRFSLIAFIICMLVSLFSMGFLGLALIYVAAIPIAVLFPNLATNIDTWHGDWVWPTLIALPMVWSFGFLIAGWIYLHLQKLDWTNMTLKTTYIAILLLWNLLICLILILNISPEMT